MRIYLGLGHSKEVSCVPALEYISWSNSDEKEGNTKTITKEIWKYFGVYTCEKFQSVLFREQNSNLVKIEKKVEKKSLPIF